MEILLRAQMGQDVHVYIWNTYVPNIHISGRYIGLPVEERICGSCNTWQVEDEQYFCVGCPAMEEARAPLLHILNLHQVDTGALPDENKFIAIMQSPDSRTANFFIICF